jgi:hypothetical protein
MTITVKTHFDGVTRTWFYSCMITTSGFAQHATGASEAEAVGLARLLLEAAGEG